MTDPSEDEMERAERIRKLRSGGARSRSHEVREQRREDAEGVLGTGDGEEARGRTPDEALEEAERVDVVELAADLPPEGSLFVVPVRGELRREFNALAEELHLQYGFRYDEELDAERHLRPLALYLGLKTLEDTDVDVVRDLLRTVDALEAPSEEE